MNEQTIHAGDMIRGWRQRRKISQLDLSLEAGISQRHLSFVETGRASPSREMVLNLAGHLAVPLREQNVLLAAAGYAPLFGERSLEAPEMESAMQAVRQIVNGHAPHPALAVDRHWNLVMANDALQALLGAVSPDLLAPPVNVLRVSFHPDGLAPLIRNFRQWRAHVLERLAQQIDLSGDAVLQALRAELESYPVPYDALPWTAGNALSHGGIAVPVEFRLPQGLLRFISTTTVFGTATDITLSELTIETFFPLDAETGEILRNLAAS